MTDRLIACYHVSADAMTIDARALAIAVEQSVEMPVEAITDPQIHNEIVGRVDAVTEIAAGLFEVRIALAVVTTGNEPGQLMNMLFGNSSILEDVTLADVVIPTALLEAFGGPPLGLEGLRRRLDASDRALTCSALKPQGLSAAELGALAGRLARGGLDLIKDDHGLADQAYSPFADRVRYCSDAVAAAREQTGIPTRYLPSLSGTLDQLRRQVALSREAGLDAALIAPMIVGLPSFHAIARENPDFILMAHPAMAGAAKVAPPLLLGTLFRLFGADATVFPNLGGRFGYSPETCRRLAGAALGPLGNLRATAPVPAGGMSLERVPEMLSFYGADVILLIGGNLLAAGAQITERTAEFVDGVRQFAYQPRT